MPVAAHIAPVLARARSAFEAAFGHSPRWAAAAPGRVNLIGEHTDYNGGFVLPIAIDRVCVAVAAPASDPEVSRVLAADLNDVGEFDARSPILWRHPDADIATGIERGSWLSYIAGVFAQFQRRWGVPNLDIAIASSVPIGAGLSSSAAVEVATATLLEQVAGTVLDPLDKAQLCQQAEHEFAGVPCGIMDQHVTILGRAGHAALIDCQSLQSIQVPITPRARLFIINSNVRHVLAGGEYRSRRAACESAAEKLGIPTLSSAVLSAADIASLSDEEQRCVRHVVSENDRTRTAAQAIQADDLSEVGRLMLASHASLRDEFRVSCSELDTLVDLAMKSPGVLGARMTGAGFGGCVIVLAERDLPTDLPNRYRQRHGRTCESWAVMPSDGCGAL